MDRQQRWSLAGRTALVTGGTRGIGRAAAEELAAFGAEVIVSARTPVPLPDGWRFIQADLGTAEGVDALISQLDRLDILVCNAGTNVRKPTVDLTREEIGRVMGLNCDLLMELVRHAHPLLRVSGQSSVVFTGSVAGLTSVGTGAAYAASKAAVTHLARYLACEWAKDGIRVNCVAPWYIRTELVEGFLARPGMLEKALARTPMGRIGEPEEVGSLIAYLCLPAAGYITGQTVAVDGGFVSYGFDPWS